MIDGKRVREIEKREYQERAIQEACAHWASGKRSVLLVAPPGSGKTEMGIMAIRSLPPNARVVWLVHTRDLAIQARDRIAAALGEPVNVVMGGALPVAGARITVAVVHSLLGHPRIEGVDLLVLDEAHHYAAKTWGSARFCTVGGLPPFQLGLTATPQRDDGAPLGDIFDDLVVAAQYSELIAGGWIVPAVVVKPKAWLRHNYAEHPVDAWAKYSGGKPTICFFPLIETAALYHQEFRLRGISSGLMHSEMSEKDRASAFGEFESGESTVLCTVAAAIEGLNVPHCECVLLGRSFTFVGGYMQAVGRVLRAHKNKKFGVVIDLTGASVRHGDPDVDRAYTLAGEAISGDGEGSANGGSDSDREPLTPEVVSGVPLVSPIGWESTGILPIALPPPDPEKMARSEEVTRQVRRMRTRHGEGAAKLLKAALLSVEP